MPIKAVSADVAAPADRVIMLANAADPDSVRLANYYASKRAVPTANVIALPMSAAETIEWPEFVTSIWQPLQDELVRRGWIDAVTIGTADETGRLRRAPHGHRISYLVVCRGVPLRINHSAALYRPPLPTTDRTEVRTNQAAVDSELALLAMGTPPINGFVDNPLFNNERPSRFDIEKVVKVTRLDGPTYDSARALVDGALAAERDGLRGRAYVDIGGIHPDGDRWLEDVAAELGSLHIPTDVDRDPRMIAQTARFDAPVLYFGWYSSRLGGPFGLGGFKFPAGAIALAIHSTSASTVRSDSEGWVGPFVARGVTATVGNVFEPYLQFTHRPNLLLHGLASGMTFGDAVYYALPVLSWQSVAIGDPLYRPFARSYDAKALPRLTLAYDQALAAMRSGDNAAALRAIAFSTELRELPADQWGLARLVAVQFGALREPLRAIAIYKNLFAIGALPNELRSAWLPEAIDVARAAGDAATAAVWEKSRADLAQ